MINSTQSNFPFIISIIALVLLALILLYVVYKSNLKEYSELKDSESKPPFKFNKDLPLIRFVIVPKFQTIDSYSILACYFMVNDYTINFYDAQDEEVGSIPI